ncbi:MAG: NAD-binding protein [Geminicoccaceae bacterium]
MPIYRVIEPTLGKLRYRHWQRQGLRAIVMLLAIGVACGSGLYLLDSSLSPTSQRLFNAIWNTANTVSTLGDLTPLTHQQKIFMMVAMLTLMTAASVTIASLTGVLSSPEVLTYRENRRMERVLAKLDDHVIVVGYAALGQLVAAQLAADGTGVVVIDRDQGAASLAADRKFTAIQGAAEDEATLRSARVDKARAMVVTTADPSRKLTTTLMARALNPRLFISTVGDDGQLSGWLAHAGASDVVVVDRLVADALVSRLRQGLAQPGQASDEVAQRPQMPVVGGQGPGEGAGG